MLNNIVIHGRLTQDVELKKTQSGVSVCEFSVAVDRDYQKGEDKIADFFTVVCWRGLAENIAKWLHKGKEIAVKGRMQSEKWTDKDGNNRVAWKLQAEAVDFCGSKTSQSNEPTPTEDAGAFQPVGAEVGAEDVPF